MKRHSGSALLVVLTVMTGLMLLMTSWWQAVGWAEDVAIVRQRYIARFYATEVVLNYGVRLVKKEFAYVTRMLTITTGKKKFSLQLDGGVVQLDAGERGKGTVIIDRVVGDRDTLPHRVMVTALIAVDDKIISRHRCLVQYEGKGHDFVVSHFSFGINH